MVISSMTPANFSHPPPTTKLRLVSRARGSLNMPVDQILLKTQGEFQRYLSSTAPEPTARLMSLCRNVCSFCPARGPIAAVISASVASHSASNDGKLSRICLAFEGVTPGSRISTSRGAMAESTSSSASEEEKEEEEVAVVTCASEKGSTTIEDDDDDDEDDDEDDDVCS